MNWERIPLGNVQTNCYILEKKGKCLIIDPGAEFEQIELRLENRKWEPEAILLTHAHFDHIGAVEDIRSKYRIPVYIHEREADWLSDPVKNASLIFFPGMPVTAAAPDVKIRKEGVLRVGSFSLNVMETPGHTPGSISYYVEEQGILFCGDTLFYRGIGRTDLPGGDFSELSRSIQGKIFRLPEETRVLPGHGPSTTVGYEKRENPFLSALA
jgi:Metallo-beta-lactamase superfamily.